MVAQKKIAIGFRFDRLTVIGDAFSYRSKYHVLVQCDCGTKKIILAQSIRLLKTRSCGCLQKEASSRMGLRQKTHGESHAEAGKRSDEYGIWATMICRCENPNATSYERYGGRGIKVCARWRDSFAAFLADMGRKPSPTYSIDRINNDGNYEPGNCKWSTKKEQRANQHPPSETGRVSTWEKHIGRSDSPIEAMFLDAFCKLAVEDGFEVARMLSTARAFVIKVEPQRWIGNYRVDFLISYRYFGPTLEFVVECDGHEFHEKTKAQARRDKKRDREIGPRVYHFTGSEINACPELCAREMLNKITDFQSETSAALYRRACRDARARDTGHLRF